MNKRELGSQGEKIACDFLTDRGYEIMEKNFWSRYGEIDIIAQQAEVISFIEVKTTSKTSFITPQEQITTQKKKHLEQVARYYFLTQKADINCRFDIVAISGVAEEQPQIQLIKNAFLV